MKTTKHEHDTELTDEQLDQLAGGLTAVRAAGDCTCGCGCCCCSCGCCCQGTLSSTALGGNVAVKA